MNKIKTVLSSSVILGIWTNFFFHVTNLDLDKNDINEIDRYIKNLGGYIR